MAIKADDNPFQAGTGHVPKPLAGRDDETELLTLVLNRLASPRVKFWGELAQTPYPPVKIVGPRGVGKTALLNWLKQQAKERGIRFVSCERLNPDEEDHTMRKLLADISLFQRVRHWIKGASMNLADKFGAGVELSQSRSAFTGVVGWAVRRKPLLLLMDEVQHYDLTLLRAVLQGCQKLIEEGYPLGLVLAGTPGLDSHLDKAESTFIVRSQNIYINALSDEATREALRVPFEHAGVKVAPDAMAAMAAQTDRYPFFIHVVGAKTWNEVARTGRMDVDVEMVGRIEEQARKGRRYIYSRAYRNMKQNKLLPYARQVMELLERKGGKVHEDAVTSSLVAENGDVDDDRAEEIYESLREDGFIWTVDDETSPGIPSFFNYFKDRQQKPEDEDD